MQKKIYLSILFVLFFNYAFSQLNHSAINQFSDLNSNNNTPRREKESKVKRFAFHIESGVIPIGISTGTLDFAYKSADFANVTAESKIDFVGKNTSRYTSFLFEWQTKRNLIIRTLANTGSNGKDVDLSNFGLGLGYAFGGERLQIFPFVDYGFGEAKLDLGSIKNKYQYLTINEKEFNSSTVQMKLSKNYTLLRPSIGFNLNIVKWVSLRANVGYSIASFKKFDPINFSGTIEQYNKETAKYENVSQSTSLPFDSNELKIKYNGETFNSNSEIFNKTKGLNFSVGLSINLVNNLLDGR
jgi:hypothetical protein